MRWTVLSLLGVSLLLGLLVYVSYRTFQHFYARMDDPILSYELDRSLRAQVSEWIPVEVSLGGSVPVRLSKVLEVDVPIHDEVGVLIDDDFTVPVDATVSVPIDQEIFVEAEVPVDTEIPLEGADVRTRLLGLGNVRLPLTGSFPVRMVVPLKRSIHVKTHADVRIQEEVTVHVKKQLTLPLDLKMRLHLPIDDVFDVRLPPDLAVKARMPQRVPVDVNLRLAVSKSGALTVQ